MIHKSRVIVAAMVLSASMLCLFGCGRKESTDTAAEEISQASNEKFEDVTDYAAEKVSASAQMDDAITSASPVHDKEGTFYYSDRIYVRFVSEASEADRMAIEEAFSGKLQDYDDGAGDAYELMFDSKTYEEIESLCGEIFATECVTAAYPIEYLTHAYHMIDYVNISKNGN